MGISLLCDNSYITNTLCDWSMKVSLLAFGCIRERFSYESKRVSLSKWDGQQQQQHLDSSRALATESKMQLGFAGGRYDKSAKGIWT
jgi:hypothetical protein